MDMQPHGDVLLVTVTKVEKQMVLQAVHEKARREARLHQLDESDNPE